MLERVRILPHRNLNPLSISSFKNPIPAKAIPGIMENITLKERSGSISALSEIGPIRADEKRQNKRERIRGLILKRSPRIAPAKAEWDIKTPTKGILKRKTQTPTIPQPAPVRREAIIALWKNLY